MQAVNATVRTRPGTNENHPAIPVSQPNRRKSVRNNAKTAPLPPAPASRTPGQVTSAANRAIFRTSLSGFRSVRRAGPNRSRRSPDEGPVGDIRHPRGGLVIRQRQRRRTAQFAGLRPFDVRLRQQPLSIARPLIAHHSRRLRPGRRNTSSRRPFEHGAVIGLCHIAIPQNSLDGFDIADHGARPA